MELGEETHKIVAPPTEKVKAVGLISGGLDSALAVRIIKDLGVDVYGLYFSMPWGCCDKDKACQIAEQLKIKFMTMQLDESYLEIVKKPQYGYGTALNPCVDCRVHMFSRARQYMASIHAHFVFTGEVIGQRPMSQMRRSMEIIEKESGLEGRLLRPLCAHLLEPTIPERNGIINRESLLAISGRSRKEQMALAEHYDIRDYLPAAGGCLLTDKNFARRMQDTFTYGYRSFRETISLKWGRHFRISKDFKAIVGRDEEENESLKHCAHTDDLIFEFEDRQGPTLILKGESPPQEILEIAGGLVQRFSKKNVLPQAEVLYWPKSEESLITRITARPLSEDEILRMRI
jgi:tRNA U34 2-thiouridine synthase MnmA/TrmU